MDRQLIVPFTLSIGPQLNAYADVLQQLFSTIDDSKHLAQNMMQAQDDDLMLALLSIEQPLQVLYKTATSVVVDIRVNDL